MDDLKRRANELADWVDCAARTYSLDRGRITAVGFSNGANIASAMMFLRPEILSAAVLFRPMVPLVPDEMPDLSLVRVLLVAGKNDPIATPDHAERLSNLLLQADARVQIHWSDVGHMLEDCDIQAARDWLLHPSVNV